MEYEVTESLTETTVTPSSNLLAQLEQQVGLQNQSAEDIAAEAKAARLANLEASAFLWIGRGREANIELGRVYNQIKPLVGHGNWESYYEARFTPRGVPFRTAQSYMKLASESDDLTKNADSALFPPASDAQATSVSAAVEVAKQQVANATGSAPCPASPQPPRATRKPRLRLDGIYRLPLFLTAEQKDNLDELRKSQNWHGAELAIIATLKHLFVQYGLVNPPEMREAIAANQPHKKVEILPDEPFDASEAELPPAVITTGVTEEELEYEDSFA